MDQSTVYALLAAGSYADIRRLPANNAPLPEGWKILPQFSISGSGEQGSVWRRVLGIASSTVKVMDAQTNEVLGEYTRYSRASSFTQIGAQNPHPWLSSYTCG